MLTATMKNSDYFGTPTEFVDTAVNNLYTLWYSSSNAQVNVDFLLTETLDCSVATT